MKCASAKCANEVGPSRKRFCSKRCQRLAYYAANPERYRAYSRGRLAEDPRHSRDRTLRYKYSIGCEDYERMAVEQGGKCAICGGTKKWCSIGDFFSVDHDHATGEVRGLLCGHCNRGIGMLCEDPRIRGAAVYLDRSWAKRAG
jgi:endogenous inhibitor of DNA gyrase (YacG/DUF329 family)